MNESEIVLATLPLEASSQFYCGEASIMGTGYRKELIFLAGEISDTLRAYRSVPTNENIRGELQRQISMKLNRIGHDALSIVKYYFYQHITQTPELFSQVVRTCERGT